MAISPEQKKHGIVLGICLVAILALCFLMRLWFAQPTTTLGSALSDDPASTELFTLEEGASFNGQGKLRIGTDDAYEEIEFIRVTAEGMPITQGSIVRENPNTFKVKRRGANDTKVTAHPAGTEVQPVATIFFPENNASFGEDVDELFFLILWITGIAFILTEAFWLFCVVSFWDGPGKTAAYTHGNHKFELGATLSVVTILVLLALWQNNMWTQMKQVMPVAGTGNEDFLTQWNWEGPAGARRPVHYQIVGLRFKWYFRHPGIDGKFGTGDDIARPDMTVPAGRDVLFHLRSQDVLHSFFLPNFRVKQDAVPGMAIPGWFQPVRTGDFQIMCAELCGEGHTTMGSTLKVLEPDAFREWVLTASAESAEENLGANPYAEDFDPADRDPAPRAEWYGADAKFWWWWDSNPVKVGYAEDFRGRKVTDN